MGNYPSGYEYNLYLSYFDRWLKEELKCTLLFSGKCALDIGETCASMDKDSVNSKTFFVILFMAYVLLCSRIALV